MKASLTLISCTVFSLLATAGTTTLLAWRLRSRLLSPSGAMAGA